MFERIVPGRWAKAEGAGGGVAGGEREAGKVRHVHWRKDQRLSENDRRKRENCGRKAEKWRNK